MRRRHRPGRAARRRSKSLDRGNLFLIPLDDRRRWYRYHHLFADVLRARLLDEQPELVGELHRRASRVVRAERRAARGDPSRDGGQGLRPSGGPRRAGDAGDEPEPPGVDAASMARGASRRADPDADPCSATGTPGRFSSEARPTASKPACRTPSDGWTARPSDAADRPPGMVVVDEAAFRDLPAAIAIHRAGQARILGDAAGTIAHARRALDLVAEDDYLGTRSRGRPARARVLDGRGSRCSRALLRRRHGEPGEGRATLPTWSAAPSPWPTSRSRRDGFTTRCARTREGCSFRSPTAAPRCAGRRTCTWASARCPASATTSAAAVAHLRAGQELGDENGLPQNPYRVRVAMARIRQAEGDLDGALELLDRGRTPVRQ